MSCLRLKRPSPIFRHHFISICVSRAGSSRMSSSALSRLTRSHFASENLVTEPCDVQCGHCPISLPEGSLIIAYYGGGSQSPSCGRRSLADTGFICQPAFSGRLQCKFRRSAFSDGAGLSGASGAVEKVGGQDCPPYVRLVFRGICSAGYQPAMTFRRKTGLLQKHFSPRLSPSCYLNRN